MKLLPLTNEDYELIEAATKIIKELYSPGKHVVGAALRTKDGHVISAIHVEAFVGRITLCAEAIALGKALSEGYSAFDLSDFNSKAL